MMCLEANRRGAFLGAVFSKILHLLYRFSPRPRGEVFEFLSRPLPIPCQHSPGSRGSRRALARPVDAGLDRPGNKNRDGTARGVSSAIQHHREPRRRRPLAAREFRSASVPSGRWNPAALAFVGRFPPARHAVSIERGVAPDVNPRLRRKQARGQNPRTLPHQGFPSGSCAKL